MPVFTFDKPSDNIGEVTLIGTGGGYGESCVIHLGFQSWIVVDSCINPTTKESLPLEYLKEIGVNLKTDVKLIVCTHWHDDHIKGISQLLQECDSSEFAISQGTDKMKFLYLVGLDYQKYIDKSISNASTIEFNRCLDILRGRNNRSSVKRAIADRTLLSISCKTLYSEVISLSPSDYTVQQFDEEIARIITEFGNPNMKIVHHNPNSRSVVLFLKLGTTHRAILGADLEVTNSNVDGWFHILDKNKVIDKKASLIKIPHHGSETAYHKRIWCELVEDNNIAKLTPWNKNNKLPQQYMLKTLCSHSDNLYMTSSIKADRPKQRNNSIEKMIKQFSYNLKEITYDQGIIRSRIDMSNPASTWTVELEGAAFCIKAK